jgi:hypothetical protein
VSVNTQTERLTRILFFSLAATAEFEKTGKGLIAHKCVGSSSSIGFWLTVVSAVLTRG